MFDTAVVNELCELPSSVGSALAGSYGNEMGAQYTNEIIEDELDKSLETKFESELRLRLRGGPGSKYSNSTSTMPLFNGVGLMKEYLPASQRTNPIFGPTLPKRKDRPLWSYKFFGKGEAYIMPNNDLVIRFPAGNLIRKIFFKGCGSKILINGFNLLVLLNYVKYAIFIKRFIATYGIKYVHFFRTKLIHIVVTGSQLVLTRIHKLRPKLSRMIKTKLSLLKPKRRKYVQPIMLE